MPLVTGFGVDPLWYSAMLLVMMQTSYLTAPMARSISFLRAIAPPEVTLTRMYEGLVPFILCQRLAAGTDQASDVRAWRNTAHPRQTRNAHDV